jgi:hypothetical protein
MSPEIVVGNRREGAGDLLDNGFEWGGGTPGRYRPSASAEMGFPLWLTPMANSAGEAEPLALSWSLYWT